MQPILEVKGLCKQYGGRAVLDDVGLQVAAGQIVALLGPNGAGKTTALECVEGLRTPDRGNVQFLGRPIRSGRVPAEMGVQLQLAGLPGTMTVAEALRFVSAYRGARPKPELLERFELAELRDRQYRELSVGQQRRLQLALAIAHQPQLVILDEPTAGLDVATRSELHAMLRQVRTAGTAIVLATHDMAEAELLADRCTILLGGRVRAEGTPRELTAQGDIRTRITVSTVHGRIVADPTLIAATVQNVDDGYAVYLSTDAAASVRALLDHIADRHDALVDLRVERPTLEERFLELTQQEAA